MSSHWQEVALGDICQIEIGGTPSRSESAYWWNSNEDGERLPWVSISDLQERVIVSTKEGITRLGIERSNAKYVPQGTLLMSFKLTIGKLAFAGKDLYTNEAIASLYTSDSVYPEFLYYGLQYWNLTANTDQAIKGVTLNKQKLQEIPCLLPPLPEQKKIAEILSGIDNLLAVKTRRIEKKQMMLRFLIEDAIRQELSVEIMSLRLIGKWKGGGTPSKMMSEFWNGTIPWISPKDMKSDKIVSSQDQISESALQNSPTSLISANSILFVTRSGILRHTLPISITTKDVAINQDLKALTPNSEWDPSFLLYFLKGRSSDILSSCMKSGTTVESIDTTQLQNYKVPFVAIETQRKISTLSESVARAIDAEVSEIESLKILRSGLSSDLLSGRKRVTI